MNDEFTKSQRHRIRELGALAYQRDLSAELANVEAEFRRWRANEIDAHALADRIHQFHQGPARELFVKYQPRNLHFMVAHAIHRNLITEEEAGPEMLDVLERQLAFFREREDDEETVDRPS